MYTAYNYNPRIELPLARFFAWTAYGYVQGQQMTGIWVRGVYPLPHETKTQYVIRSLGTNVGMGRSRQTIT